MNILKIFLSSRVNILSVAILLAVSLSSFATTKKGGESVAANAEAYELTEQYLETLDKPVINASHTYRFVDAEGVVKSEFKMKENEVLDSKQLQGMLHRSDKLFSSNDITYFLID